MDIDKIIEASVSDSIIEKPVEINIGGEVMQIAPPSFGKMQMLSKLFLQLEIDEEKLGENAREEAMNICSKKTDTVCTLIAVATLSKKEDLLDIEKVRERADFIKWNAQPKDLSVVVIAILSMVDYSNFINSIALTKILRQNNPKKRDAVE